MIVGGTFVLTAEGGRSHELIIPEDTLANMCIYAPYTRTIAYMNTCTYRIVLNDVPVY